MDEKSSVKLSVLLRRLTGRHSDDRRVAVVEEAAQKRRSWFVKRKDNVRASVDLQHLLAPSRRHSGVVPIAFDELIDKRSSYRNTTIRISITPQVAQDS